MTGARISIAVALAALVGLGACNDSSGGGSGGDRDANDCPGAQAMACGYAIQDGEACAGGGTCGCQTFEWSIACECTENGRWHCCVTDGDYFGYQCPAAAPQVGSACCPSPRNPPSCDYGSLRCECATPPASIHGGRWQCTPIPDGGSDGG